MQQEDREVAIMRCACEGLQRSAVACVQTVPVPRKRRLRFLEPQVLAPSSMQLRLQQALLHAELRLTCVHKRATLVAKEAELGRFLKLPEESRPRYVREFDVRSTRANTERLGQWLGNSLNYCLYTQGPLCATLLLKAGPDTHVTNTACLFVAAAPRMWPQQCTPLQFNMT